MILCLAVINLHQSLYNVSQILFLIFWSSLPNYFVASHCHFCLFMLFFYFCVASYEVLMLTSKCEVCGLPDKGPGLVPGQFPCGHTANHRRTSNVSVSSGYYNTVQDSPVPSPTGHFLTIGSMGGTPLSPAPVKDSSKSLLASICRYNSVSRA